MMVGEISQKIDRGKHTTRHSELFSIGDNTYLMDTPGFSSLYLTDFEKEDLKSKTLLTLSMNSGTRIPILFTDENFLKKVLNMLEEVMKAGSIGHQNITVNIKGCDIHGNAKILTDMGIK